MTYRAARLVLCASLLLLPALIPSDALAATAYKSYDKLVFSAASGEANKVAVSVSGSTYTVTDTGAAVTAGSGCTSAGSNTVTCTSSYYSPIHFVWLSTADQDDTATVTGAIPSWIDGGSGNDRLVGGDALDWLYGNSGDDSLDGGLGADSISGGDGVDTVDYSARSTALTLTLDDKSGDGQAGENDNVRSSVEDALGGSGNDSVTGSTANNTFNGGLGDDTLTGAGGDDTIDGGAGADSIDGGDGVDLLRARDGFADHVSCGAGTDSVDADTIDAIGADCEVPAAPGPAAEGGALDQLPSSVTLSKKGTISLPLSCPASFGGTCRGTITLTVGGGTAATSSVSISKKRVLARKKFKVKSGQTKVIKVTISRNGRRRVLLNKRLKCRASAVTTGASGRSATARKNITVKAPKRRAK
jgi:Ca2+-binding RTX toxin-like protein